MTPRLLLAATAGVAVVAAVTSTLALRDARSTLRTERDRTAQLIDDVSQVASLRRRQASAQFNEPPEDDLLARVRNALSSAGLAPSAFAGLASAGDETVRTSQGRRRKTYRLELKGVDPPGLGAFLDHWRTTETLWQIEAVELRRETSRTKPAFAASIRFATLYAAKAVEGP